MWAERSNQTEQYRGSVHRLKDQYQDILQGKLIKQYFIGSIYCLKYAFEESRLDFEEQGNMEDVSQEGNTLYDFSYELGHTCLRVKPGVKVRCSTVYLCQRIAYEAAEFQSILRQEVPVARGDPPV